MIINADEERVFVNLDVVDAVWSDAPRRDHYNVGIGALEFEVSRQVGDTILDALEKRDSELGRFRRMMADQRRDRVTKAEERVAELHRVLGEVLKQWSADTADLPDNQALWKEANELIKNTPAGPPEQVTA